MTQMRRFNLGPVGEADCPVFDGMFEYCAVRGLHVCHLIYVVICGWLGLARDLQESQLANIVGFHNQVNLPEGVFLWRLYHVHRSKGCAYSRGRLSVLQLPPLFYCLSNACRPRQQAFALTCDGLLQVYSGGSVGGAALLNEGKADVCVNWAGKPMPVVLDGYTQSKADACVRL